jgi:signal transduction histidine kinase
VPHAQDELRELAQTFNELLDRLQRSFDGQERFIADASHQLKTPLSILRGELDVLMSRARSPEEFVQFLGSASQEINQLIRMTEDLLILARVDAGQQSLHMSTVHLEELIVEATSRLEKLAHQKHIKLQVDFGEGPQPTSSTQGYSQIPEMPLQGDPELLACMIANLIENAIKYSGNGSTVQVHAQELPSVYQIEIGDQGVGIDPARLPHIFERFYRAQQGRSGVAGTGLGLAIAQQIARVHQGQIYAVSELGKGSLFTIEIKKN